RAGSRPSTSSSSLQANICGPQAGAEQETYAVAVTHSAEQGSAPASPISTCTFAGQSSESCTSTDVSRAESCAWPDSIAGAAVLAQEAAVNDCPPSGTPSSARTYFAPGISAALSASSTSPCASAAATSAPPGPQSATRPASANARTIRRFIGASLPETGQTSR